jgi:predicted DNA-binding transcriptional regulator AlpA
LVERKLYNMGDVSLLTSVSKSEIYREIEAGRFEAPLIGGRRRATLQAIETWLGVKIEPPAPVSKVA